MWTGSLRSSRVWTSTTRGRPVNTQRETVTGLVAKALTLCEQLELELPVFLLRDALDCLTDGDFDGSATAPRGSSGERGGAPYPSHRHHPFL